LFDEDKTIFIYKVVFLLRSFVI